MSLSVPLGTRALYGLNDWDLQQEKHLQPLVFTRSPENSCAMSFAAVPRLQPKNLLQDALHLPQAPLCLQILWTFLQRSD